MDCLPGGAGGREDGGEEKTYCSHNLYYLSLHTRILQPSSHSVNAEFLKGPNKLLACFEQVELAIPATSKMKITLMFEDHP